MYFAKELLEKSSEMRKSGKTRSGRPSPSGRTRRSDGPPSPTWRSIVSMVRKTSRTWISPGISAIPASSPISGGTRSRGTGASTGPSACFPAWGAPRTPMKGGICCSSRARRASARLLTSPPSWATTRIPRRPGASAASAAWPSTPWRISWSSSTGSPWTRSPRP